LGAAQGAGTGARITAGCAYDPLSPQIAMCGRTEWVERMCRKIEARRTRDMQKRRAVGRTRSRSASPAGGARTREARGRRLDKAAAGLVVKRTESRSASPDFRPERERLDQFLQLVDVGERDLIRINAERQKGVKGLAIGGFVRICARR